MVIDIFPFNNELDMLEIRMNTLSPVVNLFIVIESAYTFTGIPKPYYFYENSDRFKNFNFVNIKLNDVPYKNISKLLATKAEKILMSKINEEHQKNAAEIYNEILKQNILLVGDVDEIPDPHWLSKEISCLTEPVRPKMKFYYYYINNKCDLDWVTGTVLLQGKDFISFMSTRKDRSINITNDYCGWHMSYFGSPEFISEKINNLTDMIVITDKMKGIDHINNCMKEQKDLFDRDISWRLTDELDCPQYMLDNLDKFEKYIFRG